jgi:hypothetical protein
VEPINGLMVAQTNTRGARKLAGIEKGGLEKGVKGQVHPHERETEVFGILDAVEVRSREQLAIVLGEPESALPEAAKRAAHAAHWSLRADAVYAEIATRRLDGGPAPDLLAVYLGWPDVAGHHFWPLTARTGALSRLANSPLGRVVSRRVGPEGSLASLLAGPADRALWPHLEPVLSDGWTGSLPRSYEHVDRVLGELGRRLPPRSTIIVVSDHGMRPWGHYDAPPAFLTVAGHNIRARTGALPVRRSQIPVLGSILDVTPTLLVLAGLPVARDMDGEVLDELLLPASPTRPRPPAVASYDDAAWRASRSAQAAPGAAADEERLEQLRALGYIQ